MSPSTLLLRGRRKATPDHLRAFAREEQGHSLAHAGTGSRDDGDFTVESHDFAVSLGFKAVTLLAQFPGWRKQRRSNSFHKVELG